MGAVDLKGNEKCLVMKNKIRTRPCNTDRNFLCKVKFNPGKTFWIFSLVSFNAISKMTKALALTCQKKRAPDCNLLQKSAFSVCNWILAKMILQLISSKIRHERGIELASFKEDQRPNCCNAASHVGAAVLAHVARSGRLAAPLRWTKCSEKYSKVF